MFFNFITCLVLLVLSHRPCVVCGPYGPRILDINSEKATQCLYFQRLANYSMGHQADMYKSLTAAVGPLEKINVWAP